MHELGLINNMEFMTKKFRFAAFMVAAIVVALVGLSIAQDDDGPMSDLRFVVLKDYNGKPVRNAAVVLHPVGKQGKQSKGGMELKTDGDGRANIDGIPYGPLRIQVLAPGFQTFGEDYQIDKPSLEIAVRLKRPGGQFSTYGSAGDAKKPDDKKPSDQKAPDQAPSGQKPVEQTPPNQKPPA